jgi:plastocyanin
MGLGSPSDPHKSEGVGSPITSSRIGGRECRPDFSAGAAGAWPPRAFVATDRLQAHPEVDGPSRLVFKNLITTNENIMKYAYLFTAACVLILVGSPRGSAAEQNGDNPSEAKAITVTVKSLSFDPKKLEVHVGDAVVWTNQARTKHTAISDDDGKTFDTDEIAPGQSSKPVKFEREGEFRYHCKVHGKTMSGTVVVKAKAK